MYIRVRTVPIVEVICVFTKKMGVRMISQCYDCKFADEYLAWWWYPYMDPTCMKGHGMNSNENCLDFEQVGRLSR